MRNEDEEKLAEKSEQIKKIKNYSRKRVRNTYTHTHFFFNLRERMRRKS